MDEQYATPPETSTRRLLIPCWIALHRTCWGRVVYGIAWVSEYCRENMWFLPHDAELPYLLHTTSVTRGPRAEDYRCDA